MTWLIQKIIYQIDSINDREHPSCNGITLFVRQLHRYYEKLMYVRIYNYLDRNKLIYSKQFGFRSKYSTNHAIISITEHIRSLLDKGQYVGGIFIDLEKAFDTVNHKLLCEKMEFYGFNMFRTFFGHFRVMMQSYKIITRRIILSHAILEKTE